MNFWVSASSQTAGLSIPDTLAAAGIERDGLNISSCMRSNHWRLVS